VDTELGTLGTLDALRSLPLEHALRHTAVGVAACDRDGHLTLVTPVLQQILGRRFTPVPEEQYTIAFDMIDDRGLPLPIEQIPLVRARHGEVVRDELVLVRRPDGTIVHLRCNASPMEDDNADVTGAIVFVQDVTAEVAARQLATDERRLLLERVHHEIRTPLTTLLGYAEMLHESTAEMPYQVQFALEAIDRAGDRLRNLLAELGESVDDG
jgi:PAS domain S-box-containing protein